MRSRHDVGVCGGRESHLFGDGIEEAWADLQQLPAPARTVLRFEAPHEISNVIEFGALEDDDEPAAEIAVATAQEVALPVGSPVAPTFEPIVDPSRQLERIERIWDGSR